MNNDPKVGDRRSCNEPNCGKTQTLIEQLILHPNAGEAVPGWICPSGHLEIETRMRPSGAAESD